MVLYIQLSENGKRYKGLYQALVDDIDFDLALCNWTVYCVEEGGYAHRKIRKDKKNHTILMHRVILERILDRPLLKGELVDHVNGNGLDNRRENLRLATYSQNQHNRKSSKHNISGLKGANWDKTRKVFHSSIAVNGKKKYLGTFKTAEEAHIAYCEKAKELFGEFWSDGT